MPDGTGWLAVLTKMVRARTRAKVPVLEYSRGPAHPSPRNTHEGHRNQPVPHLDVADPAFSITSDEVMTAREQHWYATTPHVE